MALCRIGVTMPWLGDPFAIPLNRFVDLYREANLVNNWRIGRDDPETEEADRIQRARIAELRAKAKRAGLLK